MTKNKVFDEVRALREKGGFALVDNLAILKLMGMDAGRLLQVRSTNDVFALQPGHGHQNAFLDRTGHLLAVFGLYKLDDYFLVVAEKSLVTTILSEIESSRFRDELFVENSADDGQFWLLEGPRTMSFLREVCEPATLKALQTLDVAPVTLFNQQVLAMKRSISGEDGFLFWLPERGTLFQRLSRAAELYGLIALSKEALNIARIEAAQLSWDLDMDSNDLITDTGLEQTVVSYTKGCYLGQEVVARIKTYSAPRKGIVGLAFSEDVEPCFLPGSTIYIDGVRSGQIKSATYSPTGKRTIALASLLKEYRCPGEIRQMEIEGTVYLPEVVLLPFYRPRSRTERAKAFYEEALSLFAQNEEVKSLELLRCALDLDPLFADCYEVLGVILSRQHHLDEAIELMQKLAQVDPESVMAHSNLSVFYLKKGDKEKAEEEKAFAMSLQMQKLAKEAVSQKQHEQDKMARQKEAKERINMFLEVLEIDSEDFLANYGLGSSYLDLEDYKQAITYLQKATQVKPSHTASYLALGKAYQGMARRQDAIVTYKDGIAVATKQGDMMPLKEMQLSLAQLLKEQGSSELA